MGVVAGATTDEPTTSATAVTQSPRKSRDEPPTIIPVLAPVLTPIGTVSVERRPGQFAFCLLRHTATDREYRDNDDIPRLLHVWDAAMQLGEPLLVLSDFTDGRSPPLLLAGKLLQPCLRWAHKNARAWDAHVQGIALVIPSPMVRRFLETLTRMLAPPQPVRCFAGLEEAVAFLRDVRIVRSYVKASYT